MPNRLAQQASLYLRQHQNNPVDWYPWGAEALERSRSENRPILLSIGYSACHWCHVMEHESFEDPVTAEIMNANFVCIKVDREERPDLDHIYQNVAFAMTRGGGWPLTVFLSPDLKPFYGGLYFPPEDRYGRPGFKRLLTTLADLYRENPDGIRENAERLTEYIAAVDRERVAGETGAGEESPNVETLDRGLGSALRAAADRLLQGFDWENGGFGGAPKFPNPMSLSFLWRMGLAVDWEEPCDAVALTLEKMARGGIFDQLRGGFHRYAVDGTWSVPHFEKMLYDNGLLLKLYAEVLLAPAGGESSAAAESLTTERRALFQEVLESTVEYVLDEMVSPSGLFYSAQDADSGGKEGDFFVWNLEDLRAAGMSVVEAGVFAQVYGISEAGNFEESGSTVLFRAQYSAPETDPRTDRILAAAKKKALYYRSKRVRPATDDKSIIAWNGLMVSGLAAASAALRSANPELSERARSAAQKAFEAVVILARVTSGRDRESHRESNGDDEVEFRLRGVVYGTTASRQGAFLDDYAFLAQAAVDLIKFSPPELLAETTAQVRPIATGCVDTILAHFDSAEPGWHLTADDHEALIHRPKSLHDQAIPSGTSVTIQVLLWLAELDTVRGIQYAREADLQLVALQKRSFAEAAGRAELLSAYLLRSLGPCVVGGESCSFGHFGYFSVIQKPANVVHGNGQSIGQICHRGACVEMSDRAQLTDRIVHLTRLTY